jgi:alanine dehydrogenase
MIIGVPKEIKDNEYRVSITPAGVTELIKEGHKVYIQKNAGIGSGINDYEYTKSGAEILETAKEVFDKADMIMKIKEPLPQEFELIKENQILFTYFHFASGEELTKTMVDKKAICIAYETVETDDGETPLLTPMSEVSGRMAPFIGAFYLNRTYGGRGILPTGVTGVEPAHIVVLGGGTVGCNAAKVAAGLGAKVTILDKITRKLRYLEEIMPENVSTLKSNSFNITQAVKDADILINCIYIVGAKTPKVVTRQMVKSMKPGSVIVCVDIDQGGSVETARPTSHSDPIYIEEGVIHYCVTNIPAAFSRTSTFALTNETLPYALQIANKGWQKALKENPVLKKGLNVCKGKVTYKPVADAHGLKYTPINEILE